MRGSDNYWHVHADLPSEIDHETKGIGLICVRKGMYDWDDKDGNWW